MKGVRLAVRDGKTPIMERDDARQLLDSITGADVVTRQAVLYMVKRRCKAAGLPSFISNHSFRAICATFALENGARLEDVQELLGHADPGTTQMYNRKAREQSRSTVEYLQVV